MIWVEKVWATETIYRRGRPQVTATMPAREAIELGEFLMMEFPNDGVGTDLGRRLVSAGQDALAYEQERW